MSFILGIQGAAGAGKDTVADYLIESKGWDGKLSFAQNLKEMCQAIFALTPEQVNTQDGKMKFFDEPKIFTDGNLGSVMFWMSLSHPQARIAAEDRDKVRSLVGSQMENPRKVLQFIGTNICRTLVPNYHLDVLSQKITQLDSGKYIITDVRFPNEGDLIVGELGGTVIHIDRASNAIENIDSKHPSETSMSSWGKFAGVLNNDKEGLTYLYEKVDAFIEEHGLCQIQL